MCRSFLGTTASGAECIGTSFLLGGGLTGAKSGADCETFSTRRFFAARPTGSWARLASYAYAEKSAAAAAAGGAAEELLAAEPAGAAIGTRSGAESALCSRLPPCGLAVASARGAGAEIASLACSLLRCGLAALAAIMSRGLSSSLSESLCTSVSATSGSGALAPTRSGDNAVSGTSNFLTRSPAMVLPRSVSRYLPEVEISSMRPRLSKRPATAVHLRI
mmetsp:Transcript_133375/g.235149  ORF Transcript_133375/g.235149 Transcript_133375/m.235149 type:complete len:220 (+) Transcript_133375:986-1645(+)